MPVGKIAVENLAQGGPAEASRHQAGNRRSDRTAREQHDAGNGQGGEVSHLIGEAGGERLAGAAGVTRHVARDLERIVGRQHREIGRPEAPREETPHRIAELRFAGKGGDRLADHGKGRLLGLGHGAPPFLVAVLRHEAAC